MADSSDRSGDVLKAATCRVVVQEELSRLEVMLGQVRSLSGLASPASAVVDRKADKLNDIVVAAKYRKKLLQEEISLGNITIEDTDTRKSYHTFDQLWQEAESVAKQIKRPLNIEDWMVDAESVVYDMDDDDSLLGEGASGAVYCGRMNHQVVAVKVFNTKGKTSRQIEAAIGKEIKAWHQISDHKNIISLLGVSTKVKHFIVSELCQNGTAREYLGMLRDEEERWRLALVDVLADAAEGLQYLHSTGLIHRDIKGTNILVRDDGTAAIGDFGLSRVVGNISTTSSTYLRGTLNWCSPEQLTESPNTLTPKTDVWSFGMTVVELLSDKEPFADYAEVRDAITTENAKPPIPTNVPQELQFLVQLIVACCRKQPEARLSDSDILDRLNTGIPSRKPLTVSPILSELLPYNEDTLLQRRVLDLVVLQRNSLTPANLVALLGIPGEKIDAVISNLQSSLTADDQGHLQLKNSDFAEEYDANDKMTANLQIASSCLEVLVRELRPNMCSFRNASEASLRVANMSTSDRKELRTRIPAHVAYAARFWASHVCNSDEEIDSDLSVAIVQHASWPALRHLVETFAITALVYWIEVLAAVGYLDVLPTAAANLTMLLQSSKALELFHEATTLLKMYPVLRLDSPACIYVTVIPRLLQSSPMRRIFGDPTHLPFAIPAVVAQPPINWKPTRTIEWHSGQVMSVATCSDNQTVISGSNGRRVNRWETETGRIIWSVKAHSSMVTAVSISSDGQTVVSGSWDKNVKIWNGATGRLLRTLKGHSYEVNSVTISSDGQVVASASDDRTVKLWNAATGQLLKTLKEHRDSVLAVAISTDNRIVVSGSADTTVRLWDVATGELLETLGEHDRRVHSVAISRDGKTIVSGSGDKTVKLWETATGKLLHTLEGHYGPALSVTISSDGQTVVSGSSDHSVHLWDVATGQLLKYLMYGHSKEVSSVAISNDGKTIISGSWDETIKIWRAFTS